MRLLPKRGPYTGRLAFDPDTEFHVSVDGRKVVTDDAGKTWRYATKRDTSHNLRYHDRHLTIRPTTSEEHGNGALDHAHHLQVLPSDAHFYEIGSLPDRDAVTATGHTDAWKDTA